MEHDSSTDRLKAFAEYKNTCNTSCGKFHLSVYLALARKAQKSTCAALIQDCVVDETPRVRLEALRILIRGFVEKKKSSKMQMSTTAMVKLIGKRYLNDPFNEIRYESLMFLYRHKIRLSADILESIYSLSFDENTRIRASASRILYKLHTKCRKLRENIAERLCTLIRDKSENVRVVAARSLKYLNFPSAGDLFDKSRNGAFVYGLEDEYRRVRGETIKSMYFLCCESIKSETFDFLVDLLNDDNKEIRVLVSCVLKKLSKKFIWEISPDNLNLVVLNLEEISDKISRNLLSFCSNVRYTEETFYIFQTLVDKIYLGKNVGYIYRCIHKMVENNVQLFYTNRNKIYPVNSKISSREPSILDKNYLARLIALNVLRKHGCELDLPLFFKDHFKFLQLKCKAKKKKRVAFVTKMQQFVSMIEHAQENSKAPSLYKRLFIQKDLHCKTNVFFKCLYGAVRYFLATNSTEKIEYLCHKFSLQWRPNAVYDLDSLKAFLLKTRYEDIKLIGFVLNIPTEVFVSRGNHIHFEIGVAGPLVCEYALRVEDALRGLKIYYKIQENIVVSLDEPLTEKIIVCVVKEGQRDVLMSTPATVAIRRT
eukprot:jgi/Antlo1/2329/1791